MMVVQNFKFELLFESGIKALQDGYYREATTSFAVALERFYEFSIILFLVNKFINPETYQVDEVMLRKFEKLWKTHLKFSERQLGSFYILYFNEFSELPLILDSSFSKQLRHNIVKDPVNLRNRAVHDGYIPTHDEAVEFGEAVHMYINYLLDIFYKKYSYGLFSLTKTISDINTGLALIRSKKDIQAMPTSNYETFINSGNPSYYANTQTFRDYLANGPRR